MASVIRRQMIVVGIAALAVLGATADEGSCPMGGACPASQLGAGAETDDDDATLAQLRMRTTKRDASSVAAVGDTDLVACTFSRTYAFPSTVVQADPGPCTQMESRCSGKDYVSTAAACTCIINNNADGYDYDKWSASQACPYPVGATPSMTQQQCKEQFDQWKAMGVKKVTLSDGTEAMTGIGHGVLKGVRGQCSLIEYEGKFAVVLMMDVRSWSLEITKETENYLTGGATAEGHCFIPKVKLMDCADVMS